MEEDIEILEEFIEYSKDIINDMEYVRPIDVTITVDDIQAIENLINRNKLIEKKDKIIDLMAREIDTLYSGCEPCTLSFNIACKHIKCEQCIKKYFERKVEEDK